MREIRMLRATWRGLETWRGRILVRANAPVLDPTGERVLEKCRFGNSPPPYSTSRTVLGAPGGEIPPGDSTASANRSHA